MWSKLPGFRSNNKRNKVAAVFGYSFYILGLRPMFQAGDTTWDGLVGIIAWTIIFFGLLVPAANLFNVRKKLFLFTRMNKVFGIATYVVCVLLIGGAVSLTLESDQTQKQREQSVVQNDSEEKISLKNNAMVTEEGLAEEDIEKQIEEDKATEEKVDSKPAESEEPASAPVVANQNDDEVGKNLIQAKVVKVTDGDTLRVLVGKKEESIRLLLVDTPESVHPDIPEPQEFALEASQYAKDTLKVGEEIGIEIDVSERDKYGRLLAYVWVGDKMFNELLLEKGLARVAYIYPPNVKYVDRFRDVQGKAQKSGVGIWSIENYAQEDGFHDEVVKKDDSKATEKPVVEETTSKDEDVYYASCAAVKEAGKAPLREGDPGYSFKLDRDKDGIACE